METYTLSLTGPQMALILSAVEYAYKHTLRGSSQLRTLNREHRQQSNKKSADQYAELLHYLETAQPERK